jgi:hypothetical protein
MYHQSKLVEGIGSKERQLMEAPMQEVLTMIKLINHMIKDSKSNLIYIQQIWVSNKHKVSSES